MKKRAVLFAMLSSVGLSVYPATVIIKNLTNEPVWVRLNDEIKHTKATDPSLTKKVLMTFIHPNYYPDFRKVDAFSEKNVPTQFDPVRKITFIRVREYKEITGTLTHLAQEVSFLADYKVGRLLISFIVRRADGRAEAKEGKYRAIYWDAFTGKEQELIGQSLDKGQYTISVPKPEEFIYHWDSPRIKSGKKGIIELRSWGNAVRVE